MTRFPILADKHDDEPVLTAVDLLAHRRQNGTAPAGEPPSAAIFCYQPGLLRFAAKKWRGRKGSGFLGDFYRLRRTTRPLGVLGNFGVGAPVTAVLLEDLAAWGVRRFVSVGLAGGLQADMTAGSLVVVERALRDEGASHHYLPPARYAAPDEALTGRLRQALDEQNLPYRAGASWTIDAPYRETQREVAKYSREGVLAVEMETAAFFAVAQYLAVEAAALLVIGDSLAHGRWQPAVDGRRTEAGLQMLLQTAVNVLEQHDE